MISVREGGERRAVGCEEMEGGGGDEGENISG